jgi:hypothetical protein
VLSVGCHGSSITTSQDAGPGYTSTTPPPTGSAALCGEALQQQRWAWMVEQPIQPPRGFAGLDLAGDDSWDGLRIEDAQRPPVNTSSPSGGLCQASTRLTQGRCPSGRGFCSTSAWGAHNEVTVSWNVATHQVDQVQLHPGYTGALQTVSYPDHTGAMHAYRLGVGQVFQRDGAPFEISWNVPPLRNQQLTDVTNAILATFAQSGGVPFDTSSCSSDTQCNAPGTSSICECNHVFPTPACVTPGHCGLRNCAMDGNCQVLNDGVNTHFNVPPLGLSFQGAASVAQPALSTPQLVSGDTRRWEPPSGLPIVAKLDAEGPVATGTPAGIPFGSVTTCKQTIGQPFSDYAQNCVQVHGGSSGLDATNLDKVSHGFTHDREQWTAPVLGIRETFTSASALANPSQVLPDSYSPAAGDVAQALSLGLGATGRLANERSQGSSPYVPGPVVQLQGSALVMIEWARLMLADIATKLNAPGLPTHLGDLRCTGYSVGGFPNYMNFPGVCSGIEGLIIPNGAPWGGPWVDFTGDPAGPDLDPGLNADVIGLYPGLLKPGFLNGALCVDPGTQSDCAADPTASVFQNALTHVTRVLGGGSLANLPAELRDRRYYFKWFAIAYIKYLKAYGAYAAAYPSTVNDFPNGTLGSGLGPHDVAKQAIDLESLYFNTTVFPTASGPVAYDTFEYVDRDFIGQGSGGSSNWIPWHFQYGIDLMGGRNDQDTWTRSMERQEVALYSSMLTKKSDTPGQEANVNLTNLFGSVLLGGDPATGLSGGWPSYACAIGQAGDPSTNCVNGWGYPTNAPLDPASPSAVAGCGAGCTGGQVCGSGFSYVNGPVQACGVQCQFGSYPYSGCPSPTQTCANGACLEMMMDKNGGGGGPSHPLLWAYPGAWSRTPFSRGHSPITLAAADQQPNLGVAKITIPNFQAGPYTVSPIPGATPCPPGYAPSGDGAWCEAALSSGTGTSSPNFTPLVGFSSAQAAGGFTVPIDGQNSQWVSSGSLDFTGTLQSHVVHYAPYTDPNKPSCAVDGGACNPGFVCDAASLQCLAGDNTLQIEAMEAAGFLGQVFLCMDPATSDILHVGIYDSAQTILDWLASHPGSRASPPYPSAQTACQIVVTRSPADNSVDTIVSRANGVLLRFGSGPGQGRVSGALLFDPGLTSSP